MVINWLKGYFWQDSRLCFVWMLSWNWNVWLSKRTSQTWSYVEHVVYFSQHDAKTPWRTNTNRNKEKKPVNVNHPFSSLFTRKVCVSPFDAVGRSNVGGGRRELGHGPVNGSSVGFEEICLARIRCRPGGEHMVNGNSRILKWRYVNVPYFWPYFAGIFPYIALNNRPYIW